MAGTSIYIKPTTGVSSPIIEDFGYIEYASNGDSPEIIIPHNLGITPTLLLLGFSDPTFGDISSATRSVNSSEITLTSQSDIPFGNLTIWYLVKFNQ